MDAQKLAIQNRMYQYSRAIYRSIKDLIDPYVPAEVQLEYRRAVLEQCEQTMERLAKDPLYFAKPDRALFQDIRRYFPITAQAEVAWAVKEGIAAAVAFLMAERRPLTARDVKSNVEGYSEMSDEAFARRFYSDRAELLALGVPLQSQRDEFTGEELYTLRSENYFLPQLHLKDDELAALQTALYLLEGKFAYAEPLRLALQNLALGRPGFAEPTTGTGVRVEVFDPDYSPEMPGRLGKLEGAISKQRTVKFPYYSISRNKESERTVNPYALLTDFGIWYVVGADLDDGGKVKKFRVSRMRGEIRFATRRERDFRVPTDFDIDDYRGRPPWQVGDLIGEARIEVGHDTAWWVERVYGEAGHLEDDVFVTEYSSLEQLASWILRQDGRAVPQEPADLRRLLKESLQLVRERHEGEPPKLAPEISPPSSDGAGERPAGPVP